MSPEEATQSGGRLHNRVALVTGASSGIGRAVAIRFAEEGASVMTVSRHVEAKGEGRATHEIVRASGGRAEHVEVDVTDEEGVDRAVSQTIEKLGGLHILFCAAGIVGPTGDSRDVDMLEFDQHMATNVRGTFLCAQRALRHFVPANYGKVITVSSNFGLVGVASLAAYCGSKAAVIGMTKALAAEFGPYGININALCPGATKTPINVHYRSDPELQENWQRMTPLRMSAGEYIAEPSDIAEAALFLASDESRFMTGASLVVDGGWIAQ